MTLADLFAWSGDAIYDDLGQSSIAPAHRELQRRYADLQMEIAGLPSAFADQLSLPRETQSLARYNLAKLAAKLADGEIDLITFTSSSTSSFCRPARSADKCAAATIPRATASP